MMIDLGPMSIIPVKEWLENNIGLEYCGWDWKVHPWFGINGVNIDSLDDAIMFKLRFGL